MEYRRVRMSSLTICLATFAALAAFAFAPIAAQATAKVICYYDSRSFVREGKSPLTSTNISKIDGKSGDFFSANFKMTLCLRKVSIDCAMMVIILRNPIKVSQSTSSSTSSSKLLLKKIFRTWMQF